VLTILMLQINYLQQVDVNDIGHGYDLLNPGAWF
jgi:hypothetical protein